MNWFLKLFGVQQEVQSLNVGNIMDKKRNGMAARFQNQPIKYLLNDPATADLLMEVPIPENPALNLRIHGYMGGGYDTGTIQGQAAMCYVTIANAMKYMMSQSSPRKAIKRWAMVQNLIVVPRAGQDLNAYYDRGALKFFFQPLGNGKTFYTCQSADIVAHEFGHAFLDILRPDLFSQQSYEMWAFHEAFGDITAILSIMQWDAILDRAILETENDLQKSNIISRLAEEFGEVLHKLTLNKRRNLLHQAAFSLRDAANEFHYIEPEKLKDDAPDHQLSRECHNFSRVWTGAWYEVMVKMYLQNVQEGMDAKPALILARDTAARYLLHATLYADTIRFFDSVARQMLHFDKATNDSKYQNVMNEVFEKRNILRPRVLMQTNLNYEEVVKGMNILSVEETDGGKLVKTGKRNSMKLSDQFDFQTLADEPLFHVSVDVPTEAVYIFDNEDNLIDFTETTKEDVIDSTYFCLKYLQQNDLVGEDSEQPFAIKNNNLIRKHFVCRCNQNNACDPNAPEYGKPWKGENNAGCGCKGLTTNCDCEPTPKPVPVKVGCFTTVGGQGPKSYKVGSSASRKVC